MIYLTHLLAFYSLVQRDREKRLKKRKNWEQQLAQSSMGNSQQEYHSLYDSNSNSNSESAMNGNHSQTPINKEVEFHMFLANVPRDQSDRNHDF